LVTVYRGFYLTNVKTFVIVLIAVITTSLLWGGPAKKQVAPPGYDVQAVLDLENHPDLMQGAAGSAVVRLAILLDRAHFSPGEIDGDFGDNLRTAITGYQNSRGINPTGFADQVTWQSLNSDSAPALVSYTILADDVAGPFEKIPDDIMARAKLTYLGYATPSEELGERFHISPRLLALLNPGKDLTKSGQQIMVPNVNRDNFVPTAKVVVSKNNHTISAYSAEGQLLVQYPATMGSDHDPLPIGEWKIADVQQNPVFHFNPAFFWDAKPRDQKAEIPAGPRNPVGVVWIGLTKEHYGIHGTAYPSKIGHSESHGCIRLTNWDAEELSKMVKTGTPVVLQD
jgi:lipoprotein-anchoring transpeptidase ErfK/SrfK